MAQDYPALVRVFGRIGLLSFGGPAAQIALMHRELVEREGWLTEEQFLRALSFCMILPGPEAMQLATYVGWRMRGIPGGLIGGALFVLPGAFVVGALAFAYASFGARPEAQAALSGVKAAVIVIVVLALVRLASKALKTRADILLAVLAFVALFALGLPFPVVIVTAALAGLALCPPAAETPPPPARVTPTPWPTLLLWLVLWLAPLPILALSGQTLLFELSAFFAKLAVVTFGGAYSVLAYMAQDVVQTRGWLDTAQMIDALGLAETTPGPLILVTQFVGQLTGHLAGGPWLALCASLLTLWMTFVPCFLWIFAGAPHVENLQSYPKLRAMLAAVTAAVVGVIASLSLWFALNVLFAQLHSVDPGPIRLLLPDPASLELKMLPLLALAAMLLGPLGRSVPVTLALCAAAGWALGAP